MADQKACNLTSVTNIASDDYLMAITDLTPENNVVEKISKAGFITDIISTDAGNLLESGTDDNLKTKSTVTAQGNTFNGISQLVQTNASGYYPALNGSLITNVASDFPNAGTFNMPTIINNITDANNDIDFSDGFCYDLTTNVKIINTALIKRLDATFIAGTNQGGLDTGSKAISTWYHCYAISKADGTADFLFSTSATAPIMPATYVNKRRIGSIKTDSSGNIIGFIQRSNIFYYKSPISDIAISNLSTIPVSYLLSIPPISNITAIFTYNIIKTTTSIQTYLYSPLQIAQTADITAGRCYTTNYASSSSSSSGLTQILTDNGNIYAVSNAASTTLAISTIGYIDKRGAN